MYKSILSLINHRKTRIIDLAQASLPPEQFQAFRKITLEEFGERGLIADLRALFRAER
ncbi:hypothetical protein [Limibacillus halophilus]|uniref:Uncharacterized protein n=1 Tax=Limibacillus halophilus TaxID=1579333 RepID=A0A839SVR4_9PROT|nr:hypothetical protein [Limibacillus halophilus]MBB3065770.1 hypothetical protein [Limibacillus halophilus]